MKTFDKDKRLKRKFLIFELTTLLVLTITTITADILETNRIQNSFLTVLSLPSLPGSMIYMLVTGDIHGWQPGPIGQVGRIVVTIFGAWIFWTLPIYWRYRKRLSQAKNG